MAAKMVEKKAADRSRSVATVLGIGTANPPNCLYQTEYPDFYFRVTNSDHKTELRAKFNRICEKSKITKRYFHMNEEILRANPNMCKYKAPSFDARQEMMKEEVPKLGKEASLKAIEDWGQPISNITHIVFNTSASVQIPGADYRLLQLLGLKPSVKRFLIIQQGCHAGGTALRLAKDLAENNSGARVLVVSVEITTMVFHAPSETHLDILVGQAIFSDGASATIIGADPVTDIERPLFQMVTASQTFIPHKGIGIVGELGEMGLSYYLSRNIPNYIGDNIKRIMIDTSPFEISDFNSLFYVVHPGGPAIFDQIEKNLGLEEGKLEASRKVLSEYGNMGGSSIVFVLDEMRKKSIKEGKGTTGDGLEWGLFLSFGPGLTVETIMLKSVPIV